MGTTVPIPAPHGERKRKSTKGAAETTPALREAAARVEKAAASATGAQERRALAVEQIQKLLDAARSRPLAAFHERYGTEVGPGVRQRERAHPLTGRSPASVSSTARSSATA